jgi:hypothetical protein
MALPSRGALSFSTIAAEFGLRAPFSLASIATDYLEARRLYSIASFYGFGAKK